MAASTARRQQTGHTSAHDSGDYPIVIGESLRNNASSRSELLRLRYNWKPDHGFNNQKGNMKRAKGSLQLAYKGEKPETSTYEYHQSAVDDTKVDELDKSMSRVVLIFDPDRSAYVLERISHSIDLNLVSAHDQSRGEIEVHKKIDSSADDGVASRRNGDSTTTTQDEDIPDPANPFDFRHFLSEAKENAEKASQTAGGQTPIPRSRTPISVISSPSLVPGRLLSNGTSQFRQTPTSAPVVTKKPQASKPTASVFSRKQTTNKRKPPISTPKVSASQPPSKEVISESSDEESSNNLTLSRSSASKDRERERDASPADVAPSPGNVVYSEGGLVIDMGSPRLETKKRVNLDLEEFRSQTHTPTLGVSSNKRPPLHSHMDVEMKDASESEEDARFEDNSDVDEDVDVLELGSPRSRRPDQQREEPERPPAPPTPQPPPPEDDEDEDFLAAELEKAMEQGDELPNVVDEDESEVSEEE